MSKPKSQDKVILFFAILYNPNFEINTFINKLKIKFGELLFISEKSKFKYTNYYTSEMGEGLNRVFIFFKEKQEKNALIKIKKFSDLLENEFLVNLKRTINIDPGFFSKENIILATNKGFTHRVYLDDGVYADLTLYYKGHSYKFLDWTFSEYKSEEIINMFNSLRHNLL